MSSSAKLTLITVDVGNNPSRIRFQIYLKGLEDQIEMKTPADYGGLNGVVFRHINPMGKIPVLILPDGTSFYESRVISSYLADRFSSVEPSLRASTAEKRALANLINSVHDMYIASPNSSNPAVTATQGCMYKPVEQIDAPTRAAKVAELDKQLGVLEVLVVGPYCVGEELTEADLALYPTFIFLQTMMPKVFGWPPVLDSRPKLHAWFMEVDKLPAAQRVRSEVAAALDGWDKGGRFEPIIAQVKSAPSLSWLPASI